MTFYQAAKPYVEEKLKAYSQAIAQGNYYEGFRHLEDAHVIGQHSTKLHCLTHYHMLIHGIKRRDLKEVAGQVFRLVGAATKTAIGFIPNGNTGGANISPFKPLPISQSNQVILDKIKHAQS
uniref:DUF3703 domain-containing protein n=1 Tax=Ningiella ruwaisensis TaxID=2364274 RepID=UPI00109F015C|nr:DUF3703 domain-containing protein [Ningiella ruwaisensis]